MLLQSIVSRAVRSLLCASVCLSLAGCGSGIATVIAPIAPVSTAVPSIWVGAWGAAPANTDDGNGDNPASSEQSFRFLIYPTISGKQERVRFSNFFGTTPVTIGASRLAIGKEDSPAIDPANDVPLTFNNGSPSVTIAPGQIVVSDAVKLTYTYGQTLVVSMYVSGSFPSLTQHNSLFIQNYKTDAGAGNKTTDTAGSSFHTQMNRWLLLNGVDVYGPYQGTVVVHGSSTTDGFKSNYGDTAQYPAQNVAVPGQYTNRLSDLLALRLNAAGYSLGVVNAGIGGDTITPDTTNVTNNVQNGLDRLQRDVLSVPNVVAVVSYFGSIDLRSVDCKSAPAIEDATQKLVAAAQAAKVRVVLATIPPSAFCTNSAQPNYGPSPTASSPYAGGAPGVVNGAEVQRMALNAWLRSTGKTLPGVVGIADYDGALADPARPNFMLPLYNSGDNYHPNGSGYKAEAAAIPLSALLPPAP